MIDSNNRISFSTPLIPGLDLTNSFAPSVAQPRSIASTPVPLPSSPTEIRYTDLQPQENTRRTRREEENVRVENLRSLMMFAMFASDRADQNQTLGGSEVATFISMLEAAGVNTTSLKQMVETVSGRSYADFSANAGDVRLSFNGYLANNLGGAANINLSGNRSLRAEINDLILRRFEDMDHLAYGMGSRTGRNGRIDCSGFVSQIANSVDRELNGRQTRLSSTLNSTSEGQYINASRVVGGSGRIDRDQLVAMREAGQLQAGMVISTDKGRTRSGFDANRQYGIDHVVMTAERNGRLVILESRSGAGVTETDFDQWIRSKGNTTFFVTDMVRLAEASAGPRLETRLAAAPSGPSPFPS